MKKSIVSGFNISCVGDDRAYSYLPSRSGNTSSDNVGKHVLKHTDSNFKTYTWLDRGSDERQYCAPGIDLPIASIMRAKNGAYPQYHTSLDDLENVVTPEGLDGGYWAILRAIETKRVEKETIILKEMPQKESKSHGYFYLMFLFCRTCDRHVGT